MERPPVYEHFQGTTKEELALYRPKSPDFILCQVCGLDSSQYEHNSYFSHVKVSMYSSRGIWSIGDKYVIKERPRVYGGDLCPPSADYAVSKLLAEKTNVPVAKDMRTWEDKNSDWYWMERCPGTTLLEAGNSRSLTWKQHQTIGYELAEYLVEARKFTSTKPGAPDGSRSRDKLLGAEYFAVDLMTVDQEEWWARTEPRLRKHPSVIKEWKKTFEESYLFKEGDKYVLSHGDLNSANIMVKDGHITGIIDWEHGGYRSEWFEWNQMRGNPKIAQRLAKNSEKGKWRDFFAARMVEIGANVEMPDEVYKYIETYRTYVREPMDIECQTYPYEQPNRHWYSKCTNYMRYLSEHGSAASLVQKRKIREKEEAEQTAVMLAFNKLSLNEKNNFLAGKSQTGSGNCKRVDNSRYYR
ncbi:hypothetical protein sscle_05g047590 [Sclerotinia sclerotiorum 1980 UF-70]|uniref:Aminoglycoside phosphotransferase domain-containing protein n=1 Tax=Sclerotinia sclerotiorum (strain ATCC 18683 / 1980 / Ss-1) TaxID=665079 RepID=A0A1D9Q528_SCLS1|nr:hypothetical protein sscle_05g047590 [Sclerotinia sclerotiorum 1980 UF-70]